MLPNSRLLWGKSEPKEHFQQKGINRTVTLAFWRELSFTHQEGGFTRPPSGQFERFEVYLKQSI